MTTQISPNNYEIDLSGEKVRIGSATSSFSPVIRFNRWNMESFVELNLIGGGNAARFNSSTLNPDGSVTAENTYFILTYKATGIKQGFNELGGIDCLITLKRNPGLNSITFTYNHQRANAYLQPPLTQAEIDDGATRPDHVVNSIAFYGDSTQVNNSYKTGKIGHLYRMRVTDNVGSQTWADWGFGGGQSQITLTIDATWLANATYPVTIAPVGDTFGYTDNPGTPDTGSYLRIFTSGNTYTGAAGTGTSMSVYTTGTAGADPLQLGMYDTSNNLIGNTGTINPENGVTQWMASNFVSNPALSAVEYYLGIMTSGYANMSIYYDVVGTVNWKLNDSSEPFGTWPDPVTWSSGFNTRRYGIYCIYTPGGVTVPVAATAAASNLTAVAARLNGSITDDGGAVCQARFRYRIKV